MPDREWAFEGPLFTDEYVNETKTVVGGLSGEALETKIRNLDFILLTRIFLIVSYNLLVDYEVSLVVCCTCFVWNRFYRTEYNAQCRRYQSASQVARVKFPHKTSTSNMHIMHVHASPIKVCVHSAVMKNFFLLMGHLRTVIKLLLSPQGSH